jgi:hypothetical protein
VLSLIQSQRRRASHRPRDRLRSSLFFPAAVGPPARLRRSVLALSSSCPIPVALIGASPIEVHFRLQACDVPRLIPSVHDGPRVIPSPPRCWPAACFRTERPPAGCRPIYSVAAQCWPPPSGIGPPGLDLAGSGLNHVGHALVLVDLIGNRWWLVLGKE